MVRSWSISIEQDQLRQVRVTGGYNPFDFSYHLAPGERLSRRSSTVGTPIRVSGEPLGLYIASS
jgi:hypothetical protein